MKRTNKTIVTLIIGAALTGIAFTGCKRTSNPTAYVPPTPTPIVLTATTTRTNTRTPSRTPTTVFTPTVTSSPTVTSTPSDTLTPTPTYTGTFLTFTPTETPTVTDTPSPTDTPTLTLTVTPSSAIYKDLYNFDTDLEGWVTLATQGGSTASHDTSIYQSGGGSLRGDVAYTAGAQSEQYQITFPSGVDLTGKAIRCWVRVSSAVFGSGSCFVQLYGEDSSFSYSYSGWRSVSAADAWVQVSFVLGSTGWDPTSATTIGIEFISGTGGAAGQVWVDAFEVYTPTGCITPTYTALYTFDDNDECWVTSDSLGGSTVSQDMSQAESGAGSFKASVPYGANQTESFHVDFTSDANMTNKAVRCWVRVSSQVWGTGNSFVQLYLLDGSSNFWWGGYVSVPSADNWFLVSGVPATINLATVRTLGVQIISGNGGAPGDVWIDEYEVTAAPPTPTPTPTGGCTVPTLKPLYNFDFDLECWQQGGNPSGTTMNKDSGVYQTGGGSMKLGVPFNLGTDVYAQIDFSSAPATVVSITGKSIRCWVRASSAAYGASGAVSVQLWAMSMPGYIFSWGGLIDIPTADTWQQVSFTPSGIDMNAVQRIGVNFHSTGAATGDVWVDEFEIYTP